MGQGLDRKKQMANADVVIVVIVDMDLGDIIKEKFIK